MSRIIAGGIGVNPHEIVVFPQQYNNNNPDNNSFPPCIPILSHRLKTLAEFWEGVVLLKKKIVTERNRTDLKAPLEFAP